MPFDPKLEDDGHDLPSYRTPKNACLGCGYVLDMASPADLKSKPHPGAISICWRCGHVMEFDDDGKFVPLSDEAARDIAGDPDFLKAANARGAAWAEYQKWKAMKGRRADGPVAARELPVADSGGVREPVSAQHPELRRPAPPGGR